MPEVGVVGLLVHDRMFGFTVAGGNERVAKKAPLEIISLFQRLLQQSNFSPTKPTPFHRSLEY